jgi:hypothetical protein
MMRRLTEEESEELVKHIRRRTPIKSGLLWDSIEPIRVRRIRPRTWRGGAKSELFYASFVEDGTRPHQIRPGAGKKALKFYWGKFGTPRYYHHVNHPGTEPVKMFAQGAFSFERTLRGKAEGAFVRWKIRSRL